MAALKIATQEDVDGLKIAGDPQISPDGETVAYVVSTTEGDHSRSNIWAVSADGGEPRQLTAGPRSDTAPRWSPDGQTLAFLSDRAAEQEDVYGNEWNIKTLTPERENQIYLLPKNGGEAVRLSSLKGGVLTARNLDSLVWSADGSRIAFLNTDPMTEEEKRRIKDKDDAIEFEKHLKYTRVYTVDVGTGETRCVSPEGLHVYEFAWSPASEEFAVISSDLPFEGSWFTSCRLVAFAAAGPARTLYESWRQSAMPSWSPDGKQVAFLSSNYSDRGAVDGGVFLVSAEGGEARELSAGHKASARYLAWSDDGARLLTTATEQGGMAIAEIDLATGERTALWQGLASISDASSFDRTATLFPLVREDSETPNDVWLVRRSPTSLEWTQLTHLNPQTDEFDVGATESVRWKSVDGLEIQGLLTRPIGASAQGPYPLLVAAHGGPTGGVTPNYGVTGTWYELVAKGIAVFQPNFRGSVGFGLEFAEANIGDMGGMDWQDINSGIDYLVEQGIADPDRLGIGGGSYGGYMTASAVTQSTRFKAASPRAGIYDWRAFHGVSFLHGWEVVHYGGKHAWEVLDVWEKYSPINHVENVETPTLIIHGDLDLVCPVEGAYAFHRALQDRGVETELVVYPREGHGITERAHKLDQSRRSVQWFVDRLAP